MARVGNGDAVNSGVTDTGAEFVCCGRSWIVSRPRVDDALVQRLIIGFDRRVGLRTGVTAGVSLRRGDAVADAPDLPRSG